MNPSHQLSSSEADLRIKRKSGLSAALAEPLGGRNGQSEVQHQIAEDLAHLRDREENLRAYEVRLRAMQLEIDARREQSRFPVPARSTTVSPFLAPSSRNPFDDGSLEQAWDKLHRARELLEAEQSHLREDRLALNDERAAIKRREEKLAVREARLAALAQPAAAAGAAAPEVAAATEESSAMSKLTRAPFAIAKSVFSAKR